MDGSILLNQYLADFDATPSVSTQNKPYPETLLTIVLSGVNQSGDQINRLIIRFRDADRLSANPSIGGSDISLDLPKHDFTMINDLLSQSILARQDARVLTANYRVVDGKTWVNLGLR